MGIEPTWLAWKARALPLSYARWTRVAAGVANRNYSPSGGTGASATAAHHRPSHRASPGLRRLPAVLGFQFGRAFLVRLKLAGQFLQPFS